MAKQFHAGKPKYGFDRPDLFLVFLVGGLLLLAAGAYAQSVLAETNGRAAIFALAIGWVLGLFDLVYAAGFVYSSRVGKLRQRDKLLGLMLWRGDEVVLDMGCGPGIMMVGAAKRLTTGTAVGVDLWKRNVESGNRPDVALGNAAFEGVAGRVSVGTCDAKSLPFRDEAFDMVVSRAVLHHFRGTEEREQAVGEMARVLRGAGQLGLVVVDFWHVKEYLGLLRQRGMRDVRVLKPFGGVTTGVASLHILLMTKSVKAEPMGGPAWARLNS